MSQNNRAPPLSVQALGIMQTPILSVWPHREEFLTPGLCSPKLSWEAVSDDEHVKRWKEEEAWGKETREIDGRMKVTGRTNFSNKLKDEK